MGWKASKVHGIVYIRERPPAYCLSCDVRIHKFLVRNLVFKYHFLSDQLKEPGWIVIGVASRVMKSVNKARLQIKRQK